MEEHENLYEKISEILGGSPGTLKIMEQQIDIDLQMEYYDCSLRSRVAREEEWALNNIKVLSEPACSEDLKREILARLASIDKVECYRAIESFLKEASGSLRSWAFLAMNESRMLLESKILDENQVFISTGLGGKENKLRYFVVVMSRTRSDLTPSQQMVIKNEFDTILKKYDAEVEETKVSAFLATLIVLLPMQHSLNSVIKEAIEECNRYGYFLNDDFIITNVRILSFKEIEEFLERKNDKS